MGKLSLIATAWASASQAEQTWEQGSFEWWVTLIIYIGSYVLVGWLIYLWIKKRKKKKAEKEAAAAAARLQQEARAAEAKEKLEQLEQERKDREAAAAVRQAEYEMRLMEVKRRYNELLDHLPRAAVGTDGVTGTPRKQPAGDFPFERITERSNPARLGNFVAIDLETCGLNITDPVLEISAIRFENYEPKEAFLTYIDPQQPIPEDAQKINGISDDMVRGCPTIWQVMPSLNAFIDGAPLVAHNMSFDMGFLWRYGLELKEGQALYDTLFLARKTLLKPDVGNYKLGNLCQHLGIPFFNAHQALADAYAAGRLFEKLVRKITME